MSLLEVDGLRVVFGGVAAVDDVSFTIDEGSLVGLIGPNGAGKTSCIEALTGYVPAASGTVRFLGRDLTGMAPHRRARARPGAHVPVGRAVRRSHRTRQPPGRRQPAHHLDVAARPRGARAGTATSPPSTGRSTSSASPTPPRRCPASSRRASATWPASPAPWPADPRLLLLDEPAAGLDGSETAALGRHLRDVVAGGVTILLVDHDMGLVLGTCDRIVVLDFGQVLAEGTADEIRRDDRVVAAYLGDDVAAPSDGRST